MGETFINTYTTNIKYRLIVRDYNIKRYTYTYTKQIMYRVIPRV